MAREQRLHRTPKRGRATLVRILLRMAVDLDEDGFGRGGARHQKPRERTSGERKLGLIRSKLRRLRDPVLTKRHPEPRLCGPRPAPSPSVERAFGSGSV